MVKFIRVSFRRFVAGPLIIASLLTAWYFLVEISYAHNWDHPTVLDPPVLLSPLAAVADIASRRFYPWVYYSSFSGFDHTVRVAIHLIPTICWWALLLAPYWAGARIGSLSFRGTQLAILGIALVIIVLCRVYFASLPGEA
jgi:hypothetical protein